MYDFSYPIDRMSEQEKGKISPTFYHRLGRKNKMRPQKGKQSIYFNKKVYIRASAAIVGKKEGEGPLSSFFDQVVEDPFFAEKTWEEAESKFISESAALAIEKAGLTEKDIRFAFAGDLLGQLIASSFGIKNLEIPYIGLYGACSNIGLALGIGAMTVAGEFAEHVLCAVSSHFGSAEKQFRYPLEYGNQRPQSTTYTVTGSGAFVLSNHGTECSPGVMIRGAAFGKVVDYEVRDAQNMGAAMAPAAAHIIFQFLQDFSMKPDNFDKIITGDLGVIGKEILIKLLKDNHIDISNNHMDCGIEIFDSEKQDTHSGGSGCACSATVLASYIMDKMKKGEWKKVLFVPTGAMFSPTSFNEGQAVPGIAHAIWLEKEEE